MIVGIDASRAVLLERTGTEEYSFHLLQHLLRLAPGVPGLHFRLYSPCPPAHDLFPGDAPVEWRIIPFPRLWTHVRLATEVLLHPPDVLFVPSHVLPVSAPRRCVVTVHDLGYLYFPQAHGAARRLELDLTTRWNAWRASHILADSKVTRDDLVRFYGISPTKISVVYPGLRQGLAPVTDPAMQSIVQRRYGISGPYFLYVGTLQPRKNLPRVIEAYARFRERLAAGQPAPLLVLAGRAGWLVEPLFARIRELGLQESVLFPGYVSDVDLPALLSGAIGLVFPSLYEGFGFPVIEAMACGTPVITANTSSLPEVAGEAALLVAPEDTDGLTNALTRLWSEPESREELIRRGLRQVAGFRWERAARQALDILVAVGAGQHAVPTAPLAG